MLPQPTGKPIVIVIPSLLQMGWVESPPFFCAATETSHDVATQYCKTPVGSLHNHKFMKYITGKDTFCTFNNMDVKIIPCPLLYALDV
jgi:hypothetical protein